MSKEKLKKFISNNRWIIIVSIFFIVWKFFLVGVLWQNRNLPPEPDDSLIYTGFINSVKECPHIICEYPYISIKSYAGFIYLPYRLFLGIIAKIFNTDPIKIFHLSFYFGYLLLLPTLIIFLSSLTKNKKIIALSLFFLTLYNGSGSYHGFFWVTPVFFAVIIFLILFKLIINDTEKNFKLKTMFILPLFIYLHPTAIYVTSVFIFFYFFYAFLTSNWQKNTLRKVIFIIAMSLFFYSPLFIYLNYFSSGNPLGVKKTVTDIFIKKNISEQEKIVYPQQENKNPEQENKITVQENIKFKSTNDLSDKKNISFDKFLPGYKMIYIGYFLWLFPHWSCIIIFVILIAILLLRKEFVLISIYLSLLFFVLFSSLNLYGYRSIVYLWPITYILCAFGFWHIFQLTNCANSLKMRLLLKCLLVVFLSFFVFINIIYSYSWNEYSNSRDNLSINKKAFENLNNKIKKGEYIYYDKKILHSFSLNTSLIHIEHTGDISQANYLIFLNAESKTLPNKLMLDKLFDQISVLSGIDREKKIYSNPDNISTDEFHLIEINNEVIIYKK